MAINMGIKENLLWTASLIKVLSNFIKKINKFNFIYRKWCNWRSLNETTISYTQTTIEHKFWLLMPTPTARNCKKNAA